MKWLLTVLAAAGAPLLTPEAARAQTGAITGTVTNGADVSAPAPLSGATVELTADHGSRVATTDADGHYEFHALQAGRHVVTYRFEGLAGETRAIDLGAGSRQRIDVCMAPRDLRGAALAVDAAIVGVIRDHRTCAQLAGVTVEAHGAGGPGGRGHSTRTSGDGAYALDGLAPGEYTVTFSLEEYQTIEQTVVRSAGRAQPVHAYLLPELSVEEGVDVSRDALNAETVIPRPEPVPPACPSCPAPTPSARSASPDQPVAVTFTNGTDAGERTRPRREPAPVTTWSNGPDR